MPDSRACETPVAKWLQCFRRRAQRRLVRTGAITRSLRDTRGRVARARDRSEAARPVGRGVGGSASAFIVPCHRVIRGTGALGKYHWDPIRKRAIVGWELLSPSSIGGEETGRIRATAA